MDFGTRMGSAARISSVLPAAAGASSLYASPEHLCTLPYQVDNTLRVDGLLNFSGHAPEDATTTNHVHNRDAQFHTASDHLNSASMSSCFGSPQSPLDHLYVPFEEVAELEWLSKFVDESFSDQISNTYQYAGPIIPSSAQAQLRWVDSAASGGATAHVAWTSWLPLSSVAQTSPSSSSSSSSSTEFPVSSMPPSSVGSSSGRGKKGGGGNAGKEGGVRRCTHCASEKTPQWRTGPLGPKTLCNACGVRYKSGRLVPEYRPAASPTFVLTRHSNSHRKVLELRRQKELLLLKNADGATTSAASWPELHFDSHHHQQNGVC